eukprot:6207775-Pleurochrysis_carterae.AAC.1
MVDSRTIPKAARLEQSILNGDIYQTEPLGRQGAGTTSEPRVWPGWRRCACTYLASCRAPSAPTRRAT